MLDGYRGVVALFLAGGVVKWFAQIRPYEKMKAQIASLPMGTKFQQAKAQIDRGPEVSCSSVAECIAEIAGLFQPL